MAKGVFGPDPYVRSIGTRIIEKIYFNQTVPQNILDQLYDEKKSS
jgi:hypothetical protein